MFVSFGYRALANMAILQQVGLALREYGIRCAHLLMRHHCSAAPSGKLQAHQNRRLGGVKLDQIAHH